MSGIGTRERFAQPPIECRVVILEHAVADVDRGGVKPASQIQDRQSIETINLIHPRTNCCTGLGHHRDPIAGSHRHIGVDGDLVTRHEFDFAQRDALFGAGQTRNQTFVIVALEPPR